MIKKKITVIDNLIRIPIEELNGEFRLQPLARFDDYQRFQVSFIFWEHIQLSGLMLDTIKGNTLEDTLKKECVLLLRKNAKL